MKKIFSFFAAMMLLVSTASATTVYCKMTQSWWTADGAAVAVYHWGGETAGTTWPGVRMAPVAGEEGVWSYDVPADITGLIFVRVNGGGDVADWGAKTKDLTFPTDGKNLFTITNEEPTWGSPGCDGVWSVYNTWAEVAFTEAVTADDLAADASFSAKAGENMFTITVTDPDNKMVIDANPARFGTAEAYTDYTHRLKSGGKSSATKNFITATIPADGQLRIAVRTGSNSATDRNLVIMQGETELYNKAVVEADTIESVSPRTYKYITVDVKAGSAVLSYPTNGINFYAFAFKAAAGDEPQPQQDAPAAAPAAPTYPAEQVKAVYSATYNADCNFQDWGSGTGYAQEEYGKKFVTNAMGYFGLDGFKLDCSAMEKLHIDLWVAANASVNLVPIYGGEGLATDDKHGKVVELEGGKWNSIDLSLATDFAGLDLSSIFQFKIDNAANLTFWMNNLYFYTTVAPSVDLEDGYYLIGLNGWTVYDLKAADKFAPNQDADGEFMLSTTLKTGDEFKVVAVAGDSISAWYPGAAGNYKVDYAHAGEKTIYFRPAGGQDGWYEGVIYVPETENACPFTTWFAVGDTWDTETESYLEWDAENHKAIIHINVDKNGQWRAQVKYQGPVAEVGKCYRVALKMKANHALNNVTVKYQDNVEMIYCSDIALAENTEYVFDSIAAGIAGGNGILVLDFGFAKTGDIIELYDVVVEETACAAPVEEAEYYLVGTMTEWTVVKEAQYTFAATETEGEYALATTLTEGQGIKVVGVQGETQTWYPEGMGNEYVVDAAHAGAVTIYFRPAGNAEWAAFGGYIYVAVAEGIQNTATEMKAVKTVINGQLVIIKGDKIFNATGAQIR